jgi:hypothetical protein
MLRFCIQGCRNKAKVFFTVFLIIHCFLFYKIIGMRLDREYNFSIFFIYDYLHDKKKYNIFATEVDEKRLFQFSRFGAIMECTMMCHETKC